MSANLCLALLSHMLTMAARWGLLPSGSNPARGIPRFRERRRERFLSAAELARLGVALDQAEAQRTEQPAVLGAIRLLLLTGARLGEGLGLRWECIDWERGLARLPDSKTGPKILRLPTAALVLLDKVRSETRRGHADPEASPPDPSPFVFPGRVPGKPLVNPFFPWKRLCAAADLQDVRLHDLRHTYASMSVMAGLSLPMVGQLLGHSSPAMTSRYSHFADDPVSAAAEQVGGRVAAALGAALHGA